MNFTLKDMPSIPMDASCFSHYVRIQLASFTEEMRKDLRFFDKQQGLQAWAELFCHWAFEDPR